MVRISEREVVMGDDIVYRALAEHLDRLPGGFPPSTTGAELDVLRRLFTAEEAALAVHLRLDPESPERIALRAGLDVADTSVLLVDMARKGLIFSRQLPGDGFLYNAVPFVVGIWEFQVDRLTPELVRDVNAYWSTIARRKPVRTIAQMRTVPIGASITPELEATPYEDVERFLDTQDRFAVARCICRAEAAMQGEGCDGLEEACLMFGDWADYYVREGKGRAITRDEVLSILHDADRQGLILQPNNSRDAAFICCCCRCCCGVLQRLIRHPRPADAVVSRYIAFFDEDKCVSCGVCVDRCSMGSLNSVESGRILFDPIRCIGCGLCVSTCPTGALGLVLKPEAPGQRIPERLMDTWKEIAADQAAVRGAD